MKGDLTRFGKSVMLDGREIAQARDDATAALIVERLHLAAMAPAREFAGAILGGMVGCGIGLVIAGGFA